MARGISPTRSPEPEPLNVSLLACTLSTFGPLSSFNLSRIHLDAARADHEMVFFVFFCLQATGKTVIQHTNSSKVIERWSGLTHQSSSDITALGMTTTLGHLVFSISVTNFWITMR